MAVRAVLDSSVFFSGITLEGELFTTPLVCGELLDIRAKGNFERLCAEGLRVLSPGPGQMETVRQAAKISRDAGVISETDEEILALALELGAVLYTDDFAIQNVAGVLKLETRPILQRKARQVRWKYRCSGCGRYYGHDGECPVCGAAIKRKLK
jgi:UPF0271 protein